MEKNAAHDERVMSIVAMALRQPPSEREAYIRLSCESDRQLYEEISEAVDWEGRMGSFLLHPMIAFQEFARPFEAGQVIAERFEIVREIGEGGMGIVYEAFDRKRKQRIAIKSAKPGFHRLLSPELEGALKVRHPNICLVNQIHTAQTEHGEVDFLTMELLEGETLSARLKAPAKLTENEAHEIACQLCAGLAEAHRSGVVHRDLKSANLFLCPTEDRGVRVVITDFGLAGVQAQSDEIGGTPQYMAPELWRGEKASKASDIYSLGVILYELVAGRLPFAEGSAVEQLTNRPPAPRTIADGFGARWDRVVLECLSPSPCDRPQEVTAVLAALEKKPVRKVPLLVVALLAVAALGTPAVRTRLFDLIWPPPNVRLAILPFDGPEAAAVLGGGVLQDVSDRVGQLRRGRSIVVIEPSETLKRNVHSSQQAKEVLHATHALQVTAHQEGADLVTKGQVINLNTMVALRSFSGRYAPDNLTALPVALAGEVSRALNLRVMSSARPLSPDATQSYERGLYFLRRDGQSFDEAIPLFEQAARLDSLSPLPLAQLAEAYIKKFKASKERSSLEAAQRSLRDAESLSPDSIAVLLADGLLRETISQYEKALEDYRRVQVLEPRNINASLRIAGVYDELDVPDKAIEAYRQAIELDPDYYESYEDLGEYYYYRGNYTEAAEQFQKTTERAPGMFDAYTNLGAALSDLGRDAEAEQALLASLKIHETARALNSMGAMRAYQKRDAEAVEYYRRAVALDSGDYYYWGNLGDSSRRLGHLGEAQAAYQKAMNLASLELQENPRLGLTRSFVASFAARLGDAKRAYTEIAQALQLSPGDAKVIRRAVLTYDALGQRDEAIQVLSNATPQLLRELDRQPDLVALREDSRFQRLLANTSIGGK